MNVGGTGSGKRTFLHVHLFVVQRDRRGRRSSKVMHGAGRRTASLCRARAFHAGRAEGSHVDHIRLFSLCLLRARALMSWNDLKMMMVWPALTASGLLWCES